MAVLDPWAARLRADWDVAPTDPDSWRRARLATLWLDHAALRIFWRNQAQIAPYVYRSNQPTPGRLKRWKHLGLHSVLSLRGDGRSAQALTHATYCAELGLRLHRVTMSNRPGPTRDELLTLIEAFRQMEKPFLMHCKSGANRTGLAAAIYLLTMEDGGLPQARRMLSPRFLHVRTAKTLWADRVLDAFEASGSVTGFETWVRDAYTPAET